MSIQSKDFSQEFGLVKEKGNQSTSSDLYGGGNSPTLGAGSRVRWEEMEITDIPEKYKDVAPLLNLAPYVGMGLSLSDLLNIFYVSVRLSMGGGVM